MTTTLTSSKQNKEGMLLTIFLVVPPLRHCRLRLFCYSQNGSSQLYPQQLSFPFRFREDHAQVGAACWLLSCTNHLCINVIRWHCVFASCRLPPRVTEGESGAASADAAALDSTALSALLRKYDGRTRGV
mmetsp:Transcript_822/g.1988  ORF Transcript_822/g.1988 Transcript_822/m.1988 type:complete len:130 (+) Transcript_822:685-1074(+)